MKKVMKKYTENMDSKRPHLQRQGKDWPNFNGNDTNAAIPDIYPMSDQRRRHKEATI